MPLRSLGRWKRDDEAALCEGCRCPFTLLLRRHHCRACGGIYCARCCSGVCVLPELHAVTAQRVCTACRASLAPRSSTSATSGPASQAPPPAAEPVAALPPPAMLIRAPEADTPSKPGPVVRGQADDDAAAAAAEVDDADDDVDDDDDDVDASLNPVDIASAVASAVASAGPRRGGPGGGASGAPSDGCGVGGNNLSFLDTLQDGLRHHRAANVLKVLLFAGAERQQTLCVTIEPSETMRDLRARLTATFFRLQNSAFRRMTADAEAALRESLHFTSEQQNIAIDTLAADVVPYCRFVVLSTSSHEALAALAAGSAASDRSLRDFFRSERSDVGNGLDGDGDGDATDSGDCHGDDDGGGGCAIASPPLMTSHSERAGASQRAR